MALNSISFTGINVMFRHQSLILCVVVSTASWCSAQDSSINKVSDKPSEKAIIAAFTTQSSNGRGSSDVVKSGGGDNRDAEIYKAIIESQKTLMEVQNNLYQSHLNSLTFWATVFAISFGIAQIYLAWKTDRREKSRFEEESQRAKMRFEEETKINKQTSEVIEASVKHQMGMTGMVTQMTGVLKVQEATQRAIQEETERRNRDELSRMEATQKANQIAKDFLADNSIHDDGIYEVVESKFRDIGNFKASSNTSKLDLAVTVVEGLYDAIVRGDDRSAISIWKERVLANSAIGDNLSLKRRTNYFIGLSDLKLGLYEEALLNFDEARSTDQVNGCYRLARLEAIVRSHREIRIERDEQTKVEAEFEDLYTTFSSNSLNIGKMPRHIFQSELTYWYGQFLIHEKGDIPSLDKAEEMLKREYKKPEQRSSRLDGVDFALNKARKTLTIALLDRYIDQCSIEEQQGNSLESFSVSMRKARYYAYRAVIKDRGGNAEGKKSDVEALTKHVGSLHYTLNRLRRMYRDARIYSPVSRKHETLDIIRLQLDSLLDIEQFSQKFPSN